MATTQTTRQSIRQAIQLSSIPSHYVVQFDCDECICVITRKQLLTPAVPSVGEEATVLWNGEEYSAKIMAMGDSTSAHQAERAILRSMESDKDPNEPPKKKKRLGLSRLIGKENKTKQSGKKNKAQKQKGNPLQEVQKKVTTVMYTCIVINLCQCMVVHVYTCSSTLMCCSLLYM